MSTTAQPAIPRLSASLVLVNTSGEVLFVERRSNASTYSGMHVFPGGVLDASDENLVETAVRETFEETGLLLCQRASDTGDSPSPLSAEVVDTVRKQIHDQLTTLRAVCSTLGLRMIDRSEILPFTRWITPKTAARRFDTHFMLCLLPPNLDPVLHRVSADAAEVISVQWATPAAALAAFHSKTMRFMPPQYYLLNVLHRLLPQGIRTSLQDDLVRTVCNGSFGSRVFNPVAAKERAPNGRAILTYEGDEIRGGNSGSLHRAVVNFDKAGLATDIDLHVNIDEELFGKGIELSKQFHYDRDSSRL
ncbi:NUDIX domain-containing protein [Auriculariales sp. MPI-PUGE-AT-0066]|nr:NUDIX domain-containing protein [Auriculariales sp. MPI-PUGE-AT-0066]